MTSEMQTRMDELELRLKKLKSEIHDIKNELLNIEVTADETYFGGRPMDLTDQEDTARLRDLANAFHRAKSMQHDITLIGH